MTWMNEYEIDDLERQFDPEEFPNLNKAAEHLSRLRHWVNGCSDGWPYWAPPAKAAGKLMTALQGAREKRWSLLDDMSAAELKKLIAPVEKFLTARGENPFTVLNRPKPAPEPARPGGAAITGKVVIDGLESEFLIAADAESLYTQWGADIPVLGSRVVLMARMAETFRTWWEQERCSECEAHLASQNDPFGVTRLCDECISKGSCPAYCSPEDEELMENGGVCTECGTDWKQYQGGDWEVFRKNNMAKGGTR
jgi:hypothetical protein